MRIKHQYMRGEPTISSAGWLVVDEEGFLIEEEGQDREAILALPGFFEVEVADVTEIYKTLVVSATKNPAFLVDGVLSLELFNELCSANGLRPLSQSGLAKILKLLK